ncbi:LytR/AlgR family response regulator transcription factor [Saccharicrinis fermentans]|uniref:Putative transcriptional regulatory protein YehT n=2 Tax=Saccharicrinis fermentans TaxID=982 RepID=W7Y6X2_9BACT|nr:LytTR family DNA-binding domain-containing protein [Saccharicrinis fermentans]GAF04007.1 putative transcriptional regulatory protein YehT [Saccharicrinis fermentans DSM 9555 = JCM 21142]
MIKCIAIDDEPLAIQQIEAYIKETSFLDLQGSFRNALDALDFLNSHHVDLIFVDIQMPKLNGLDLVKALHQQPQIIFTTAYSDYAIDGFKLDALDYLLKPLDYPSFLKASNKALNYFKLTEHQREALSSDPHHIFIKSEYKLIRIELDNILYVEGNRGYLRFFLAQGKPIMTLLSMKKIEEKLPSNQFIRVHRSYLVNLKK